MELARVPLPYTTLHKSSRPLGMVEPICAFLLSEQQLLLLSRLVICLGGGEGGCVWFVFWVWGVFLFVHIYIFIYTNCDQDLSLPRSLCVERSGHQCSLHEV